MRYLSVCSGIEAASVAWPEWTPVAFAEIEAFPSAVLAHHYPTVPNWGDLTKFKDWPDATIDLLVGGTPCQSFSVAGLRKGLADPRGNLALTYLAVADRYRPEWLVWENVPGVLSADNGRAFGSFLGGLVELGYGWAYRVLDAQYFGLAQRRKRVFVVGCLGGWQRAAAVLFDAASLRGDSAPSREARQTAPTIPSRSTAGGLGTDFDCDGGLIARSLLGKANSSHTEDMDTYIPEVVGTLSDGAHMGGGLTGRTPIQDASLPSVSLCLNAGAMGRIDAESETLIPIGGSFDVAHSLRADGFDASEDGTGRWTPLVCFDERQITSPDNRSQCGGETSGTMHEKPMTIAIRTAQTSANGHGISDEAAHTLDGAQGQVVAFANTAGDTDLGYREEQAPGMQVRRLTPRECERLQGFPDDYTLIPYRNKPASDGPRYKALGNSMAVPVMAWIGRRIADVAAIPKRNVS